jgi:MFS family permease
METIDEPLLGAQTAHVNDVVEEANDTEGLTRRAPLFVPQRWILSVLLHLGLAVFYAMRVSISVAAAPPANLIPQSANTTIFRSNATMYTEFGWSNTDEGLVLGAFFQGYILTQALSAVLARRFGGKPVLAASMLCACVLTWATPGVRSTYCLFKRTFVSYVLK